MKTIKKTAGILTIICLMIQSTQITCSSKPLTQQKITSYDVEQKINTLKTTIKSIKKLKTITALLIAGSAATTGISLIVAAALGLGISFFSGGIALAPTVKLCVGIAASGAIITATIPAQFLAIFGIGSTAGIITAFTQAQALQNIEKQNPGTLTEEQKLVVLQFKNLAQGDIVKGIIKG
ncbi:hypothetical protein KAH94_01350, partial [bacterium]|nr:hypothetical protein [bacterium]